MSTRIQWADETWNPMTGCTPVSEACEHCYALRMLGRNLPHHSGTSPTFHPDRLDKPLRWRKPRRIFVCSMSDLFHEAFTDEQRDEVFLRFGLCPAWPLDIEDDVPPQTGAHTFMVLTKRPEAMRRYLTDDDLWWRLDDLMERQGYPGDTMELFMDNTKGHTQFPNLWLGVTVENQQRADERIPVLLDTPAAVRFVSVEPMLGPVRLGPLEGEMGFTWLHPNFLVRLGPLEGEMGFTSLHSNFPGMVPGIDWVIVGGETGPGARPMQPEWALDVYRQCKAAGVPFFWKQWGRNVVWGAPDDDELQEQLTMVQTREFPAGCEEDHR